jgi:hypothetical protein
MVSFVSCCGERWALLQEVAVGRNADGRTDIKSALQAQRVCKNGSRRGPACYRPPLSVGAVQVLLLISGRTLNIGSLVQVTKSSCQRSHS